MPDDSMRIEYNQYLQPLEELLEAVERPGDFFVDGAMQIPMPKVEVEGAGTLSLPVPDTQIQRLIAQPPEAPRDWRQDVKLSCACPDCRELQAFTLDPVARHHRFRVKQSRRQHLHQQIEHHGLDMTHETERAGSPQTLVCTKDRRSYKRRCEEYRKDIAALASLAKLAGQTDAPAELTKRIVTARALADKWSPAIL